MRRVQCQLLVIAPDKTCVERCVTCNPCTIEKITKSKPGASMRQKGGFHPILAALLAPVIGGIAAGLIEKEISASGLQYAPPPTLLWCKRSADENNKSIAFHVLPDSSNGRAFYLRP